MNHTRPLKIVLLEDGGDGTLPAHIVSNLGELNTALYVACNMAEALSLSVQYEIDVILLDFVGRGFNDFSLLERICEAFSRIPVIVTMCNDDECDRQRALRMGAQDGVTNTELREHGLAQIVRSAILRKLDYLWRHDGSLEQAMTFLQHNPASARRMLKCDTFGMKPLSEAMPHKFLELTKSYSNVIELATSGNERSSPRLSCQSVPRKLHFLASDLGALKAGVNDVFELHRKALEYKTNRRYACEEQQRKILLELLTDLMSYYRKGSLLEA